ncbi:hypothetical protein SSBR45G_28340 [Bradyrhizobium sp. SSBR45G]|uniref:ATP-binding protein n=1 Tax=unclassified Bradyrhizobium TaxID=2631580 RepID=UPI002342A38B|nr:MULTISPECIES: ATP-binding protein [unclassified Bradyrhizobium]GLH77926.1 hypothetical protein SSBR45G_28340 [Bradyrhizobium sp. SSBR45G]GLH85453.1 hypothetical protein SSBR45R_29130 [Bradyrhizobium sp. SSBR45R]
MSGSWLPIGFEITPNAHLSGLLWSGDDWQGFHTREGGRALVARLDLANRWVDAGLVARSSLAWLRFGEQEFAAIASSASQVLAPVDRCQAPRQQRQALAFAAALKATRACDRKAALHDAIYVERLSRLLPTSWADDAVPDAVVLGSWLTGGLLVSAVPVTGLQACPLPAAQLEDVVKAAGLDDPLATSAAGARAVPEGRFSLPGRPAIEALFNDHVVEIVQNRARYQALGIGHPAAIVLEGPPGCGKTFAVEQLVKFLGWPSFTIDATSIASPYIHETSRKVARLFRDAMAAAPSVIIVDEMEAFLATREAGASSQHRVEEVAEFLRRIPEASAAGVLVIAMTNRLDMIDPAFLRRGRFDHILRVDYAAADEIQAMLAAMFAGLPTAADVDLGWLAQRLAGRPLSDAAFVMRESARLAAKAKLAAIDRACLTEALAAAAARDPALTKSRIGFI